MTSHSGPTTPPPRPPRPLVVPGDIMPDPDGRVVWWKPSWGDVVRRMGWSWLWIVLPLILGLGSIVVWPFLGPVLFFWGLKLWIFLAGAGVAMVLRGVQLAAKARGEPFCIHCGYSLVGLPDHHLCPECGRPYSLALVEEYRKDPAWFVQRWKIAQGTLPAGMVFSAGTTRRRKSRDGT